VPDLGGVAAACFGACAAVDTDFETKGMDGVGDAFDAGWEFVGVWKQLAGGVGAASFDFPAVVD
jgi:hypothetical protein